MLAYELEDTVRQLDGIACALDIAAQAAEGEGVDYTTLGAFFALLSANVSEARRTVFEVMRSSVEKATGTE